MVELIRRHAPLEAVLVSWRSIFFCDGAAISCRGARLCVRRRTPERWHRRALTDGKPGFCQPPAYQQAKPAGIRCREQGCGRGRRPQHDEYNHQQRQPPAIVQIRRSAAATGPPARRTMPAPAVRRWSPPATSNYADEYCIRWGSPGWRSAARIRRADRLAACSHRGSRSIPGPARDVPKSSSPPGKERDRPHAPRCRWFRPARWQHGTSDRRSPRHSQPGAAGPGEPSP